MKKYICIILTACTLLPLLGCSNNTSSKKAAVKKELVIIHNFVIDGVTKTPDYLVEAKEVFEKKHSNITIKISPAGYFNHIDGTYNDIFIANDYNLSGFVSDGNVMALDDLVNTDKKYFDQVYTPGMLDQTRVDNTLYALPLAITQQAIFYNKGILKKHNISLMSNWNWDSFYNVCKEISKGDKLMPGSSGYIPYVYFLEPYINSYGISVFDSQHSKCNITDSCVPDWYKFEKKIWELDSFTDIPGLTRFDRPLQELNAGKFAFFPTPFGIYDYKNIKSSFPEVEIMNFPLGSAEGYFRSYNTYGCINKNSILANEAFEFLKFLTSKEIQSSFDQATGVSPANREAMDAVLSTLPSEQAQVYKYISDKSRIYVEDIQTANFSGPEIESALAAKLNAREDISVGFLADLKNSIESKLKK